MDARDLLLEMHSMAHSPAVSGEFTHGTEKPIPDAVWPFLDDALVRQTPPGHTSVAWLIWHMARAEDMGINTIVRGVPEVFDRDGWAERLGADIRHAGTGMSHEDASAFSGRLDAAGLVQYHDAVGSETRRWLQSVDLDLLAEPCDVAGERIAHSHDFLERAMRWAESYFPGKTNAWFVIRLALWHNFMHLGHMEHVLQTVGFDFREAMRTRPQARPPSLRT